MSRVLKYEQVVIGATLSSVLYAFYQNIPIIFIDHKRGHPFEFFDPSFDLSLLKIEPSIYELKKANSQTIIFGAPRQQVYDKVLSILSLSGLAPFSNLIKSLRIEEEHLKVITQRNSVFLVEYDKLFVFDDSKINGLPVSLIREAQKQTILDWFDVNLGGTHDIDYIETDNNFVKEIFFYDSSRNGSHAGRKDLVAISYLTEESAQYDYQYSDTYAKFKVLKYMKEVGIKGVKNGKNPNYPKSSNEPFKWLSPKIVTAKREILPPSFPRYKDTEKIKFMYCTPEEIIESAQCNVDAYAGKLLNVL